LLPLFDLDRQRCLFIRYEHSDDAIGGTASLQPATTRRLVQGFDAFS